jgi:CheY-like chemotaxis protein
MAGVQVATAENGQAGVESAMRNPFDLILMDMQMPVMDGYTAATLLRQRGVTVPIIALTAHAMKGDESKCRAAGCSGYITKPVDADVLVRTIAQTLRGTSVNRRPDSPAPAAAELPSDSHTPPVTLNRVLAPMPERSLKDAALYSTLPMQRPAFREAVEEFIQRLQEQLAAMEQALGTQDYQRLGRLAHWLKGAGGTAGFPAFTQPAKHLEALVRDQQCDEIQAAMAELRQLAARVAVSPAVPCSRA